MSDFGFQCHNFCKQLLSYRCDSLEPMYTNITSVSNIYLTGATIPWIDRCIFEK
ncbi:hypothetical protein AHAS_Ahas19G0148800 [Arachis hypogaea]